MMARFHAEQPPLLPTDAADLTVEVESGGKTLDDDHTSDAVKSLTRQVLEQRVIRLTRQNKKLDFEIQRVEEQFGDIAQMRREVLRANEVVKQTLYALVRRVSEQLALMEDPLEIQTFLHEQLTQAFNDLAYEHKARIDP
jgi:hypothetical protein